MGLSSALAALRRPILLTLLAILLFYTLITQFSRIFQISASIKVRRWRKYGGCFSEIPLIPFPTVIASIWRDIPIPQACEFDAPLHSESESNIKFSLGNSKPRTLHIVSGTLFPGAPFQKRTYRAGTVNAVFSELAQDKFPFSAKVPERLENERFGTKLKIFRNILSNIL